MFPLFHIAIPLIFSEIPKLKRKYRFNRFFLILGALFPDIVDKTLLFLGLTSGRFYFHSLLVVFLCFTILFLITSFITQNNKEISFSFLIGMLFHLLVDLPDIPLFYPFIQYEDTPVDDPILLWTNTLLTNPLVQITEIIGAVILIFIILKYRLYRFEELFNYLKTTPFISVNPDSESLQEIKVIEG